MLVFVTRSRLITSSDLLQVVPSCLLCIICTNPFWNQPTCMTVPPKHSHNLNLYHFLRCCTKNTCCFTILLNSHFRLNLVISNRHVKAHIEDQDGQRLVSASTEEFEITRHLYKPNDVPAALNIGRVMAQRCLEAGINRVSMYTTDIRKKEKVKKGRNQVSGSRAPLAAKGLKRDDEPFPTQRFSLDE